MSSITRSTNMNSVNRSSSSGLSGLVSGMDTESMVKKLLSGTQSKIDKQIRTRQTLTWKQEIYRDVITSINSLKSKYLSFGSSSKSNLNSSTFFSSASTVISSDAIKATALPNSNTGKVTIDAISQLATSRTEKAAQSATAKLSGKLDLEALKSQMLSIKIGDVEKEFNIEGFTNDNIVSELNAKFADATDGFGPNAVSAEIKDGKLIIKRLNTTDTDRQITIGGSERAMNILGLTAGVKPNGEAIGSVDYTKADDPIFLKVTLDGIQKDIQLDYNAASDADFVNSLNSSLQSAFGSGIAAKYDSVNDEISFVTMKSEKQPDGSFIFTEESIQSRQITINGNGSTAEAFGMVNGQSNKMNVSMRLSDIKFANATLTADNTDGSTEDYKFEINGVTFTGRVSESLSTLMNKINTSDAGVKISYLSLEDKFVISSAESGAGKTIQMSDTKGDVLNALFGTANRDVIDEGQNAKLQIGGIDIERNSNSFEYDGLQIELTAKTDKPVDINVNRDSEKICNGIKDFITDYNSLIDKLNGLLKEDATFRDYPPLTEAQKNEMSDKEIELWEKKAKSGLVRGDTDMSSFISQMRSALYTKPEGAKYALYDLGITTDSWKNNGKLVMEDPPKKLMEAISQNPQEVSKLFTDSKEGLSVKMSNIIDSFAKISVASPGIFVRIAGSTGSVDTESTTYKQLKGIKEKLESLDSRYKKEYNRYWKQFNSMERMIAQMNQQSSWLSSQ